MHDTMLNRAKTVIVYCGSGERATLAGMTLKEMGFSDVRNMGGFKGWADAGGATKKG